MCGEQVTRAPFHGKWIDVDGEEKKSSETVSTTTTLQRQPASPPCITIAVAKQPCL